MTADLRPLALPRALVIESANRVAYAISLVDGERAAGGQVTSGVIHAIFDRIATESAFRWQGFAGRIMTGLEGWAVSQGATTGLLMASVGGR